MGDVVQINKKKDNDEIVSEFNHCAYFRRDGNIGVRLLDDSISVYPLNKGAVEIYFNGSGTFLSREKLAEFLHVAAVLLDSDFCYLPGQNLLGGDYE